MHKNADAGADNLTGTRSGGPRGLGSSAWSWKTYAVSGNYGGMAAGGGSEVTALPDAWRDWEFREELGFGKDFELGMNDFLGIKIEKRLRNMGWLGQKCGDWRTAVIRNEI